MSEGKVREDMKQDEEETKKTRNVRGFKAVHVAIACPFPNSNLTAEAQLNQFLSQSFCDHLQKKFFFLLI